MRSDTVVPWGVLSVILVGLGNVGVCYGRDVVVDLSAVLTERQEILGEDVTVVTKYGRLRGRRRNTGPREAGGLTDTVDWFLGIPYAAPPVGDLRFKEPADPPYWSGVRNATKFGWICPQMSIPKWYLFNTTEVQNEDCLYLNVYAPFEPWDTTDPTYPVLVYIHGGSFRIGTGNTFLGHILALHGEVVVTINYRLEILGFLCSKEDGLPGNLGILDQIQALRWVRDNIAHFRGDPEKVTVAGNSAGSWSVGLLSSSPLADGLFQQAILQSGSLLSPFAVHETSADLHSQAVQLGRIAGCDVTPEGEKLVDCLRRLDWKKLVIPSWEQPKFSPDHGSNLRVCLDNHVMVATQKELLTGKHIHVTRVMMGGVANEMSGFLALYLKGRLSVGVIKEEEYREGKMTRKMFNDLVKQWAEVNFPWGPEATRAIQYEYTNWSRVDDEREITRQYANLLMDFDFVAPNIQQANLYFNASVPVYFYVIDHQSPKETRYPDWVKSYHESELNYVFGAPFMELDLNRLERQDYTEKDRVFSRHIMRWWKNFITHGNPTQSDRYHDPEWRRYFPSSADYYYLTADYTEMRSRYRAKKVAFWNDFMPSVTGETYHVGNIRPTSGDVIKSYWTEMWIVVGVSILLFILVLVLCCCVVCGRRRLRRQKKTCQLMHGGIITLKFDES